jgi:hypothetical protein
MVIPQVRIDEIQFLGQIFRDVPADVQPDPVGGLDSLPFEVTMALGCDVLLHKPLHVNFDTQEIGFLVDDAQQPQAYVRLDADFALGLPVFELSLGHHTLAAGFDTGAALCILNHGLLDSLREELREGEPLEVDDVTGARYTIPTYTSDRLAMGEHPLGACQLLLIDMSAIEQKAGRRLDFVFGVNAMLGHSWVVNRPQGCVDML